MSTCARMMFSLAYFGVVFIFIYVHAMQAATVQPESASGKVDSSLSPVPWDSFTLCEKVSTELVFDLARKPDTRHRVTVFKAKKMDAKAPLIVMAYSSREGLEREVEFAARLREMGSVETERLFLTPKGVVMPDGEEPVCFLTERSVKQKDYFGALVFDEPIVPFVQYMSTLSKPSKIAFLTANMEVLTRALASLAQAKVVHGRLQPSNLFVVRHSGQTKPSIKLGNFALWHSQDSDFAIRFDMVSR